MGFFVDSVIESCDGKGGGKGARVNARINKVNLEKIKSILEAHFDRQKD